MYIQQNEPNMTIMIPIIILNKSLIKVPTMFVEKCLFPGYKKIFMLLQNYQKMMCGTSISRKRKTCLLKETTLKIIRVIVIIQ